MKSAVDTSVIISAMIGADASHDSCRRILLAARHSVFSHALSETFSTLTGGRLGMRVSPGDTASMLRDRVAPRLVVETLLETELLNAYAEAGKRGIRGGAIYDYLHLVAARKVGAKRFYTLNTSEFLSFHAPGDPEILHP
jgi:predicted nucleic acid-binding protein